MATSCLVGAGSGWGFVMRGLGISMSLGVFDLLRGVVWFGDGSSLVLIVGLI